MTEPVGMTVIECRDLTAELAFFTSHVGFRVEVVRPADDPRSFVLSRSGFFVELRRGPADRPTRLTLAGVGAGVSPGGTVVEALVGAGRGVNGLAIAANQPSMTVVAPDGGGFGVGRAGMEYRDLLPDRWGGRFIASHIRIAEEGDVADWVHFHRIRFQMIFVAAGWVDLVYEDQGEPFRMYAGDCVLQPPEIRHRVLRSGEGLEVIEIGCPAEHDTFADHDLALPTSTFRPDRDFGGQRFVRHVARETPTSPWIDPVMRVRDTGIASASAGLAGVVVVSPDESRWGSSGSVRLTHDGEFVMIVGLIGRARLDVDGRQVELDPRTAVALPADTVWRWASAEHDHEALVVTLPATTIRLDEP